MKGRQWELHLEAQHDEYRRAGLALVFKTEPRRDRNGKFIEKAPPDYCGMLNGGRAVVFDAKDCTGKGFALSNIKTHQAQDLEAAWIRGGFSFIALRFQGEGFVLPWEEIRSSYQRWRGKSGRASLTAGEIDHFFRMTGPYGAGWLGGVE